MLRFLAQSCSGRACVCRLDELRCEVGEGSGGYAWDRLVALRVLRGPACVAMHCAAMVSGGVKLKYKFAAPAGEARVARVVRVQGTPRTRVQTVEPIVCRGGRWGGTKGCKAVLSPVYKDKYAALLKRQVWYD